MTRIYIYLLALLLGALLLTPRPCRAADEDTAYAIAGTALVSLVIYELSRDGDGEFGEQLAQYAAEMAPWLINVAESFLNSSDTRAALGEENAVLAVLALEYMAPRLANRHSELAAGGVPLDRFYDYGRREYPVEFAMIYRVTDVGGVAVAEGLWPRLEAWLRDKGYLGEATLHMALGAGGIRIEIAGEDRDELVELAARAIVEEYRAVRSGERIEASAANVGDGLDVGGE